MKYREVEEPYITNNSKIILQVHPCGHLDNKMVMMYLLCGKRTIYPLKHVGLDCEYCGRRKVQYSEVREFIDFVKLWQERRRCVAGSAHKQHFTINFNTLLDKFL